MANINPAPQYGVANPYGLIPGALDAIIANKAAFSPIGAAAKVGTPNPFSDLSAIFPNLSGHNNAASALVAAQQSGELTPEVLANLQRQQAVQSVRSGMPGSNAIGGTIGANRALLGNVQTSQALQQKGLENLGLLLNYGKQQVVSPELQAQIGSTNAGAENQFSLANFQAQNQMNEFNATAENNAATQNSAIQNFNSQRGAMANPKTEAEKQFALFKEGIAATKGPAVQTSWGSPAGGSSFSGSYQTPKSNIDWNTGGWGNIWNGPAASGTGPAAGALGLGAPDQNTYTQNDLQSMIGEPLSAAVSGTRDPYQTGFEAIPQSGSQFPSFWDEQKFWV